MSFSNRSSLISWPEELGHIHVLGFEIQGHPRKSPNSTIIKNHGPEPCFNGTSVFQPEVQRYVRSGQLESLRKVTPHKEPDKLISDDKMGQHELPLNSWGVDMDLRVSFTIVFKGDKSEMTRVWMFCMSFFLALQRRDPESLSVTPASWWSPELTPTL